MPENDKRNNVDGWLERENESKQNSLERGSEHFDASEPLSVNTLESVHGVESSFGVDTGKRGSIGPAGHYQMDKVTAERYGLNVSKENDERFDFDKSSTASAKQMKNNYKFFGSETNLGSGLKTIAVSDTQERKKFAMAALNGGEGRIAKAQQLALEDGQNPENWDDVKEFLIDAGATAKKAEEIMEYVEKVLKYEEEFAEKSKANKKRKDEEPLENEVPLGKGHWITKDDRRIFIED